LSHYHCKKYKSYGIGHTYSRSRYRNSGTGDEGRGDEGRGDEGRGDEGIERR